LILARREKIQFGEIYSGYAAASADFRLFVIRTILLPMADTQAPASTAGNRNVFSLLLDIFFEPRAAFTDIVANPRWWFPLALVIALGLVFTYVLSTHVGWEQVIRKAVESNDQVQAMAKEQRENLIATQAKFAGVFAWVMTIIGVPVIAAIIGAVLMFIYNNLFGGEVKFKQAFGIVVWSWIPTILSSIVALVAIYFKSSEDVDVNNLSPFNIGFYLSEKVPKWLMTLMTSVDLFYLWVIALIAVGFSVATRKSWLSCLWGVLLPWAAYVLIKVCIAAVTG
jgi:hypothetical protein